MTMAKKEIEIFKSIFDNMLDNIIVVSKNGDIKYGNKSAVEFYGYSYDELTSKKIYEIRDENKNFEVNSQLKKAFKKGIEFETIHIKKDGTRTPVKIRSVSTLDSKSEYVISIIHDMTAVNIIDRKARIFDVSLDIAEEAIVCFDKKCNVTVWNKAAEKRLGFKKEEIIGKNIEFLIPESEKNEINTALGALKLGKTVKNFETSRCHKNGTIIDLMVSYSSILGYDSEIIGFIGIYNDISEINKTKQEVKRYQEKAALALKEGKFCIWDADLKNKKNVIYNHVGMLLGYDKEEMENDFDYFIKLIHPDDFITIKNKYIEGISKKEKIILEYRLLAKTGKYIWIRTKIIATSYGENGEPIGLIGISENISDRKLIEENLIKSNEKLSIITEEAKRATEAKSIFLANMSHEIRNPLNGIIGTIELLKEQRSIDENYYRLIDMLEASSKTLKTIVTDILDISKVEKDKIEISELPFSLKVMMQEIFNDLSIAANDKGIEVGYFVDSKLENKLIGDSQKIKQILNNLTSNAIKFTNRGMISLKAKVLDEIDDEYKIQIEVKDTGIGIPKDRIDQIFDVFMQIDTTFNKKYNGAGLGLAIVKKYSDAMGGIIECESVEGEGSRFIFTKTFKISHEKENLLKMKTLFHSSLNKNNKNILSVDDSSINQNIMRTILERRGYNVLIAYNGLEAKEILEKKEVDLIFMDIQLPDINGFKLTKIIREDAKLKNIPIIAMTAYAQQEDRLKCINMGMNDYMTKPIDIDEINRILEIYLKEG